MDVSGDSAAAGEEAMNQSTPYWAAAAFMCAAIVYAMGAKAETTAVHMGGYSYHVLTGHEEDYNSFHRLAAVEYGSVMAGYFRNSYHRDTFVVAHGWSKQWGNWRGSLFVGATYGYRECYGDNGSSQALCPVAFPALYWTRYRVQPGVVVFGEAVALTARVEL